MGIQPQNLHPSQARESLRGVIINIRARQRQRDLIDRAALHGQIAPLSLLPAPLALLSYALPFGYMLWAPSEILRGGLSFEQAMLTILAQSGWLAGSWIAYAAVWRMGLRQFSAVGA